jgi:AAA domain, putative AbiEii toxin, Type IV TA system/AAA domain
MYESIRITRFRQFQELVLGGLTRVNLFVGRNNAGKTSILEAVELLASGAITPALLRSGRRRGETSTLREESPARASRLRVDVRRLFSDHKLEPGTSFELHGRSGTLDTMLQCKVIQIFRDEEQLDLASEGIEIGPQLALALTDRDGPGQITMVGLSADGGVLNEIRRQAVSPSAPEPPPVEFLSTSGADQRELARAWNKVVLTPEEGKVTVAMQVVEPAIERIAFGTESMGNSGALVKLEGIDDPVPLGSLGDGTSRVLALAMYLVRASGGVLLIDEIDTGLHYSALESIWRLVIETARRLNVQVFATSHSGDCMRALAWLQSDAPDLAADVSVHRIEKGATDTIRYSAEDLGIAAQHHIEIRG